MYKGRAWRTDTSLEEFNPRHGSRIPILTRFGATTDLRYLRKKYTRQAMANGANSGADAAAAAAEAVVPTGVDERGLFPPKGDQGQPDLRQGERHVVEVRDVPVADDTPRTARGHRPLFDVKRIEFHSTTDEQGRITGDWIHMRTSDGRQTESPVSAGPEQDVPQHSERPSLPPEMQSKARPSASRKTRPRQNQPIPSEIRETSERLAEAARRADAEAAIEEAERVRELAKEDARREFMAYGDLRHPPERIENAWRNVDEKINQHWRHEREVASRMQDEKSWPLDRAGINADKLMDAYVRNHKADYFRVMAMLSQPETWQTFWTQVRRYRHPAWNRSGRSFDDFMRWWIDGPDTFYSNVVYGERLGMPIGLLQSVSSPLMEAIDWASPRLAIPSDLKVLWSERDVRRLRVGWRE
jgi:hypothetical protein